jgi:hypothetical protein
MDGFNEAIDISVDKLTAGLHATRGQIKPGQVSTTIVLSADADATLDNAVPFRVVSPSHEANPEDHLKLLSLMPRPDLLMAAETKEVTIAPGGKADISVSVARQQGFGGRVPVGVRNLPPRVRVLDVGLNGVLITEDESRRSFTIEALPGAEPGDQIIYVSGDIETRSPQQSSYAAVQPILLHVTH